MHSTHIKRCNIKRCNMMTAINSNRSLIKGSFAATPAGRVSVNE
jgi:hypothetical protein